MLPSAVCKHCGEEKSYEELRKYGSGKVRRECNTCYRQVRKERDYDKGWYEKKLAAKRLATAARHAGLSNRPDPIATLAKQVAALTASLSEVRAKLHMEEAISLDDLLS